MDTNLLSPSYANAIEAFLKSTDKLVIIIINDQLNIIEYNEAFQKISKTQENLTGRNILNLLFIESRDNHPFINPPPEQPQHLIFISPDNSSFTLDCTIYHIENNFLIIGGYLMLNEDEIIEKMTLLSNELINMTRELHNKNRDLMEAQSQIKVLSGIIPICAFCKGIRDDEGYWNKLEEFVTEHSEALFSHGICPKCMKEHYPEYIDDKK